MTPAYQDALTELHLGDAAEVLRGLPAESVHCVITSPPYWGGIRSYRGLGAEQLGHEATPGEYVERIVGIMREVRRVMRSDASLWLNLGDNYGDGAIPKDFRPGNGRADGLVDERGQRNRNSPGGQFVGIPFRVVLALQADGWRWRDTVIWHKLAPMPESLGGWTWQRCRVKTKDLRTKSQDNVVQGFNSTDHSGDFRLHPYAEWADCPGCPTCLPNDGLVLRRGQGRTTKAHEYLFMLAKGERYYYDLEAVKEQQSENTHSVGKNGQRSMTQPSTTGFGQGIRNNESFQSYMNDLLPGVGRNRRSVWSLPPEPQGDALCAGCRTYYERRPKGKCPRCGGVDWVAHYAAFVQGLVEPCVLAGTSAKGCCPKCGANWARVVETTEEYRKLLTSPGAWDSEDGKPNDDRNVKRQRPDHPAQVPARFQSLGWRATCRCDAGEPVPCTVLDCFSGSGTTSITARRLGRRSVGIELAPDYLELSGHRLRASQPGMALGV